MKKLFQMTLFILVFIVMRLFFLFENTYADTFCIANFQCADGNSATCDWCEKTAIGGICRNVINCDDDNRCTIDECTPNGCKHTDDLTICDDGNPCTDETCSPVACVYNANTISCEDGLFCNGTDTCHGMACSVHSGNPCPAGMFCNETNNSCDSTPPITSTTTSTSVISTTTTSRKTTSTTTSIIQPITSTTIQPLPDTYSISGYVTGDIVEGVSIVLSGTASESSTTDENGYYELCELNSGYYNITPKMDGYIFAPPYYPIQSLTSNLSNMDFISSKIPCVIEFMYGEDSYEVELLRDYRNSVLAEYSEGQELIRLYYEWSPVIVEVMNEDEEFRVQVKEMIDGVLPLIR